MIHERSQTFRYFTWNWSSGQKREGEWIDSTPAELK